MIAISVKVDLVRYFEHGKSAPAGSGFKGVMTGESLVGYLGYTSREDAKDSTDELEMKDNGYIGYTQSHNAGCTRSSNGILDTEDKMFDFKKLVRKSYSQDGNLAWEDVISLASFDEAHKFGLYTIEDWDAALSRALPKFFKYIGFDNDNMIYWWDYHINKFHPHVHIIFMEKNQTRFDGYLKPSQLKALKRYTALELEARQKLCEKIDTTYEQFFKNKDLQLKEILINVNDHLKTTNNNDISQLYKLLPKTGRLQYNSYNLKDYKFIIDGIIDNILNTDPKVKEVYNEWMKSIDLLKNNINEINNSDIDSFKKAEIKKLYTRIGNMILKEYRTASFDSITVQHSDTDQKNRKKIVKSKHKRSSKKILGAYCLDVINQQQRDIEESLKEFLRINGLEI